MNNILISSAGRRVSLLKAFKEISEKKFNGIHQIFAADSNPALSSACMIADKYFKLPRVDDENYVKLLLNLCLKEDISLIIPTIDIELKIFAEQREAFYKNGIHILVSDSELISYCRDKRKTNKLFEKYNIQVPSIIEKSDPRFPLFVKPYDGSNSKNLTHIEDQSELLKSHLEDDNLVFWEYVDVKKYDEFTIDAYFDKNSDLVCLVPRQRIEVRGGEVNKGLTCNNHIVPYLRQRLSHMKGARGCLTIQLFKSKTSNDIYGIEINPRFGGGYPLSHHAGANYPEMIINEYFYDKGLNYFDGWEDKLLMLRYDEAIFVKGYGN